MQCFCQNITRHHRSGDADPWRDFFDLDFFGKRGNQRTSQLPAVNICEDGKSYPVDVVAPGFKKDDFKINMDDDLLTISAESKQATNEGAMKNSTAGGNTATAPSPAPSNC